MAGIISRFLAPGQRSRAFLREINFVPNISRKVAEAQSFGS
jgi:hypothetical protein